MLYLWIMKKKITHLICPMDSTDLTKGKVYEVVEELSGTLFRVKDDVGHEISVTTNVYNSGHVLRREGWKPCEAPELVFYRNEYMAGAVITASLSLLILFLWLIT